MLAHRRLLPTAMRAGWAERRGSGKRSGEWRIRIQAGGMVVALAANSRALRAGFGSYGAAMSIYYHFLARGRDVVYPKDMAM